MRVPSEAADFYGERVREHRLGALRLVEKVHAPAEVLPWHTHEVPYVTLVVSGGYSEELRGGVTAQCAAGAVVVHTPGEAHRNCFGGVAARLLNVVLDGSALASLGTAAVGFSQRRLVSDPRLPALVARLDDELRRPDDVTGIVVHGALFDLAALILRDDRSQGRAPSWLRDVERVVRESFHQPLSLASLALGVGVHPRHLSRAFRRRFGMGVGDMVRRLRVQYALELLRSELPLAEVALRSGFADQSHLTRWVSRSVGVSPAAYRRRWRSDCSARARRGGDPADA